MRPAVVPEIFAAAAPTQLTREIFGNVPGWAQTLFYVLAAAYRLNGDKVKAQETLDDLAQRMPTAASDPQMLPRTLRFPPELVRMVFGS